MSTAHGFLSCSNSYGWTNSCFCLISRIPIQFIQCFVDPACPAPSPRFAIGFWHADFDEAIPARMWLAQNGAQASGNTDEAGRGWGEKYGTYWIWLDLFIDVYIYIQCICAYIYIYMCVYECIRITNKIHGNLHIYCLFTYIQPIKFQLVVIQYPGDGEREREREKSYNIPVIGFNLK